MSKIMEDYKLMKNTTAELHGKQEKEELKLQKNQLVIGV